MKTKRTPKAAAAARAPGAPRDIAILHGPTEDGTGARLLRFRGDTVTAGEIRPAREGQPLGQGELVRLKPLHRELPVCEVEVLHASAPPATESESETESETGATPEVERLGPPARQRAGPARVSNRRYRRNWSAVFGAKAVGGRDDEPDYSIN
jgi:hypothetical protein